MCDPQLHVPEPYADYAQGNIARRTELTTSATSATHVVILFSIPKTSYGTPRSMPAKQLGGTDHTRRPVWTYSSWLKGCTSVRNVIDASPAATIVIAMLESSMAMIDQAMPVVGAHQLRGRQHRRLEEEAIGCPIGGRRPGSTHRRPIV